MLARVPGAARQAFLFPEAEDQDRRFAADPLGVPVNETVEHVVARHGQPVAGKPRDQGDQTVPQDGKAHGTRTIIAAFEKVACSILTSSS